MQCKEERNRTACPSCACWHIEDPRQGVWNGASLIPLALLENLKRMRNTTRKTLERVLNELGESRRDGELCVVDAANVPRIVLYGDSKNPQTNAKLTITAGEGKSIAHLFPGRKVFADSYGVFPPYTSKQSYSVPIAEIRSVLRNIILDDTLASL